MTPRAIRLLANRAIYIVDRGTLAQQDDFEDEQNAPISAILDNLWAEAEDAGMTALVRKIKRAYNKQVHG
jgi:hypothetical protein